MSREVLDFSHYRQLVLFWGLLDLVIRSMITSIIPSLIPISSIIPFFIVFKSILYRDHICPDFFHGGHDGIGHSPMTPTPSRLTLSPPPGRCGRGCPPCPTPTGAPASPSGSGTATRRSSPGEEDDTSGGLITLSRSVKVLTAFQEDLVPAQDLLEVIQ